MCALCNTTHLQLFQNNSPSGLLLSMVVLHTISGAIEASVESEAPVFTPKSAAMSVSLSDYTPWVATQVVATEPSQ